MALNDNEIHPHHLPSRTAGAGAMDLSLTLLSAGSKHLLKPNPGG